MKRIAVALLCLIWAQMGWAAEQILSYHSDIEVALDGSMEVTETIQVQSEGQKIRRGIYRDFPTDYEDRFGNHYKVGFEVLSVTREGWDEPWRSERRRNGVRVYIGDADVLLSNGIYTYEIRYQTSRQLGFFAEHDELFWNITGNGWAFPILSASGEITLPGAASVDSVFGFVGPPGATEQAYTADSSSNVAYITTTRALSPGEGLTVVVEWPKGFVSAPSNWQKLAYFFQDNQFALIALLALLGSAVYLYYAWSRHGRDPAAGVLFAQYEPPEGFSPASARYITRMSYDAKTLSAAIVNLAVKGYLEIAKPGDHYILKKTTASTPMAPGEQALYAALFAAGDEVSLVSEHRTALRAMQAHKKALQRDYLGRYFLKNTKYLWPSLVASMVVFVILLFVSAVTVLGIGLFILNAVMHGVFSYLLKAPTTKGRILLDQLAGFKLFLEVADKDDLALRHPPDLTPQLFEAYFPFAIALGVENAWAERFAEVFEGLRESGKPYHPAWFHGTFDPSHVGAFAHAVGSDFSSAISSASMPPGSSSGRGGSSGGGGGGGGGGGW